MLTFIILCFYLFTFLHYLFDDDYCIAHSINLWQLGTPASSSTDCWSLIITLDPFKLSQKILNAAGSQHPISADGNFPDKNV